MTELDIVAFLTRCLDEDQARAEAVTVPGQWQIRHNEDGSSADGEWEIFGVSTEGTVAEVVGDGWEGGGVWHQADAEFIAANSPARVLADITAKRAILDDVIPGVRLLEGSMAAEMGAPRDEDPAITYQDSNLLLRLLAAPYADRPGYNPAWAVSG